MKGHICNATILFQLFSLSQNSEYFVLFSFGANPSTTNFNTLESLAFTQLVVVIVTFTGMVEPDLKCRITARLSNGLWG